MPTPEIGDRSGRAPEVGWGASRYWLWSLIVVSTLLRLAWALGMGAAVDEAYYAAFVQHLDWSYFDHPPMVAVVGLPGLALAGDEYSVAGLRLGFVVLFAGSTWMMARLTARYYGPKAGVLAALALNASGYFGMAVGTIAQPDGPLLFFWLLTLDRLAVAHADPENPVPWVWVGLAWGGALLSKYYAVLLPAGALLYLILRPQARRCLRTPGPYLASAIGLAAFVPVIFWNARHGWASFLFQGGRASAPTRLRPEHLAVALGSEAVYLFPWLWIPLVVILVQLARRGFRRWEEGETFLVSQAVPALMLFHGVALFGRIMPYWPLIGFVSVIPLLGRCWARRLESGAPYWRPAIAAVAVAPVVLAALVAAQERFGLLEDGRGRLLGVVEPRFDPTVELITWDQVARELDRRGILAEPGTFLFTDDWNRSARLAFATRGRLPVACYQLEPRSFSFWSRPEDWVGRNGIFVEDDRRPGQLAHYAQWFHRYEAIGSVRVVRRGSVVREVYLYRGTIQTWPFPFDGRLKNQEAGKIANRTPVEGPVTSLAR